MARAASRKPAKRPTRPELQQSPQVGIPTSFALFANLPVAAVNQFALVVTPVLAGGPGELTLNVGYLAPPSLVGTLDQRLEQAQLIERIEIQPVARLSFSLQRAAELRDIIDRLLAENSQ
jgi:hypothetical protein